MPRLLTNQTSAKIDNVLVGHQSRLFKCLFSSEIEDEYNCSTIHDCIYARRGESPRNFNQGEKLELHRALCAFLDESSKMTYTDVMEKYSRRRDEKDMAWLDEDNGFPIDHLAIAESGIAKCVRLHGYMREGIFVIKRMDWARRFHKREQVDG